MYSCTTTREWTIMVYDAIQRSYVEEKLCKKSTILTPHIWRLLKISPPKVEKPTFGTELYHRANFTLIGARYLSLSKKYIFLLYGSALEGYRPMLYIFRKLSLG